MAEVVYIDVTIGTPTREWCDRCHTSARLVVPLYELADDGPHQIAALAGCTRCDPDMPAGR